MVLATDLGKLGAKFHAKVRLVGHSSYKAHPAKIQHIKECQDMNCDCSTDDCSNVNEGKECPLSCSKKPKGCKNQDFRRFYETEPCFEIAHAAGKGFGLFAKREIKKKELVILYNGEIITKEEFQKRHETYHKNGNEHYYMFEAGKFYIDPTVRGNSGRFANHSCKPNLEVVRRTVAWRKEGFIAIGYRAKRDIRAGRELTIDYNFAFDPETSQICRCRAKLCKGWIGERPQKVDINLEDEQLI